MLLASVVLFVGCQRKEPMGLVRGQVTLDGQAVSHGVVLFSNHDKGVHILAPLEADGHFELQMAQGYGLPIGDYQVAVNPPAPSPPMLGAPPPPTPIVVIPRKYLQPDTSGLVATIEKGANTFDISMHSD